MKISVISERDIPSKWAHTINTVNHAEGFYKIGHEVEILTIKRFKKLFYRNYNKKIQNFYGINHNIKIKFFLQHPIDLLKRFNRIYNLFNKFFENYPSINDILDPNQKIANYCLKNKTDLAYCRSYLGAYWTIKKKIPTVVEIHTNKIKKIELKSLISLTNNTSFLGIVTIHDILKEKYCKLGMHREKIIVLEDAVDLERFDKVADNRTKYQKILNFKFKNKIIMYCGSLKPGKGIPIILKTAHLLNNYQFVLVGGSKEDIDFWKLKIKKENIHNVYFTGFIPPKLIPILLKSADVLFMPYDLQEENRVMDINTTSPLKLFEYMASKRPIISTKISTIEKIVTNYEHAILTNPNDINDIILSIEMLLEDSKLANRLTKNAYEKVKQFTYYRRCQRILSRYII